MERRSVTLLICLLAAASVASAHMGPGPAAPPEPQKATLRVQPLAEGAYCLYGQGGNIGIVVTPGAVLMVDTQFDSLAPAIQAEIQKLTSAPLRYVVNTHYHFDHTGGNPTFGKSAPIVGHENVRLKMYDLPIMQRTTLPPIVKDLEALLGSGRPMEPEYKGLLEAKLRLMKVFLDRAQSFKAEEVVAPAITFSDSMKLYLGDEEVQIFHVAPAHTDGDAIVWFPKRNVVHMGDVFVNGMFPFIDVEGGGSSEGWMKNLDAVLSKLPPGARVIPGHGEAASMTEVKRLRAYIHDLREAVGAAIKAGKSLEQAVHEVKLDAYKDFSAVSMNVPQNIDQVWREMGGKP